MEMLIERLYENPCDSDILNNIRSPGRRCRSCEKKELNHEHGGNPDDNKVNYQTFGKLGAITSYGLHLQCQFTGHSGGYNSVEEYLDGQ